MAAVFHWSDELRKYRRRTQPSATAFTGGDVIHRNVGEEIERTRARRLCATIAAMRRALAFVLVGCVLSLAPSRAARAQPATEPLYTPSTFSYGFNGFLLGAGAGLGTGYLFARSGGFHDDDWQPLAYGAGIGALAGGVLGLSLGITDMVAETPGRGYFVIRDGGLGLGFGMAAGAIAGGIAATSTKRAENILYGAAIGTVAGTAVGIVLGIIEGHRYWDRHTRKVAFTTLTTVDAAHQLVWMPGLVGRY
jgi:hypothetical protein